MSQNICLNWLCWCTVCRVAFLFAILTVTHGSVSKINFFCYIDKNSNSCFPVSYYYIIAHAQTTQCTVAGRDVISWIFRKFKRSVIVDIWKRCYVVSWIYCQLCSVSDVVRPGCRRYAFFKRSKTYYVQDNRETLEILSNNMIV